jgi:hypothetical protein
MCPTFLAPPSMPHDAARRTSTKAIHWSAWKRNSAKFACRILHKSRPWDRIGRSSSDPTHSSQHFMLWSWIDMRDTVFCSALRSTDNKATK